MGNDQPKGSISDRLDRLTSPEKAVSEKPEAVPTSKSPEVAPEPKQEAPAEVPQEQPTAQPAEVEENEALANSKNPDRTRAYIEKLKSERDEALKATKNTPEPQVQERVESPFDIFNPPAAQAPIPQALQQPFQMPNVPYLNPLQIQNLKNEFVKEDGSVDIDGLNHAFQRANQEAYQLRQLSETQRKQMERFEQKQEEREAYQSHPEIDPTNKAAYNKRLFNLVTDRLVKNMFLGKKESLAQVTSQIKSEVGYQPKVDTQKVEAQAVEKYKETQRARVQGPFEAGRGEERMDSASLEDLRKISRHQGPKAEAAISQRLKALGI